MQVLKLIQQHNFPILQKYNLGNRMGDGSDGELFILSERPHQVIKFSVVYDDFRTQNSSPYDFYIQRVSPILDYVMLQSPQAYVRVVEHGYVGAGERNWNKDCQKFIVHYYIMERLEALDDNEKKVVHTLLSHEDRLIKKDYTPVAIKKTIDGLLRGLDFDAEKVILFCDQLRETPLYHNDLHMRNIMKDKFGYFKLIDLDRVAFII